MADAAEVWAGVQRSDDVRYSALVPNLRGAQRALDAGFREIEVVVSAPTRTTARTSTAAPRSRSTTSPSC
jgi:hypothetical protein